MAGRDAYIWYYSDRGVNGALEIDGGNFQKILRRGMKSTGN